MKRVLSVCGVVFVLAASQRNLAAPQPSLVVPAADCTAPDTSVFSGPTVISDFADGLSSDGRGAYVQDADDVVGSVVSHLAALTIYHNKNSNAQSPRTYSVNLDNPVRGGGGRPLGIVKDASGSGIGLMTQWSIVSDTHNGGLTLVTGKGTTPATIHRITKTKWAVDLPAGSIGRLFDVADGTNHAVDKGLYHFRLHYEIGK